MRNFILAVVGAGLLAFTGSVIADDAMATKSDQMAMMKMMDTNGDGKMSKEEYMAYYTKMWDGMKVTSDNSFSKTWDCWGSQFGF